MTKRKGKKDGSMDVAADPDEGSGTAPIHNNNNATSSPHMLPSGLKPKLDLIFAEVEQKLPDIDFDFSDVDSDNEEPILFHQNLKSHALEEDKDLDTSQNSESLSELSLGLLGTTFPGTDGSYKGSNTLPVTDNSYKVTTTNTGTDNLYKDKNLQDYKPSVQFYDNDLAYELQRSENTSPIVTSLSDIPEPTNNDKNRGDKNVTSWREISADNQNTDTNKVEEASFAGVATDPSLSLNSYDDKHMRKLLDREKNRDKEKDLAMSIVSPRGPVLSTQVLDNIDLDTLLQNLSEDNQLGPPAAKPAWTISEQARAGAGEGASQTDKGNMGLTLIQRLAQLSMDQCGEDLGDIDPSTGAKRKQANSNIPANNSASSHPGQADNRHVDDVDECSEVMQAGTGGSDRRVQEEASLAAGVQKYVAPQPEVQKVTKSCGTSTSDFKPRVLTARLPPIPPKQESKVAEVKKDKEPTVFIDLRNFDQKRQEQQQSIERVQQVLGINPDQGRVVESSDSEDEVEDWFQQRRRFKQQQQQALSKPGTSPVTRTSNTPNTSHVQPPRVINLSERSPPVEDTPPARPTSQPLAEDREELQRRQREEREKERRQEIVRRLREERENELKTKLRLQKKLDVLKPTASVSGKQDPAESTPTIYDLDASYEPAPRNLPPVLSPDTTCVLLNIHLSSNGEIVLHRGGGNKSVDTGTGLSASYTALLTWLLALVPSNFTYLQDGATSTQVSPWLLPFYVVGCQQVLMDDQLSLMVAVTPVEQFDAKCVPLKGKKSKNKTENKGTAAAFQQHLTKYFSTNTLHSVCPWLQNMVSMDVAPMAEENGDNKPDYIYRPPLPNITTKPLSTFIHVNPDPQFAAKIFNSSVGFFWQTVDSDEVKMDQNCHDEHVTYDTQNTISLIYKKIYQEPSAMMGILNRVLQLGLDLAGVRLVYPTAEQMNLQKADNASALSELELLNNVGAVLCLCIRGTAARSLWLDAVGPSDPALARRTDPNSLCALYGGESRDECLLFCPRTPARVQTELARWFGGRVPPGNVIDVGTPYTKKDALRSGSPKGRRSKKVTFVDAKDSKGSADFSDIAPEPHRPLATLTATTRSEIFLVLSPLVPPKCFGVILASCQRRGFQVTGVKRCRLSSKRAAALGIQSFGVSAFCPGSSEGSYSQGLIDSEIHREAISPSTIIQLQKENASHSAASLVEDCMVQLTFQGIMGTLQQREGFPLEAQHMFHAARYSDNLITTLAGDFSKCFDPEVQINPSYVIPQLYTNPELEQISVLLLLGHDVLKTSGLFIGKILNVVPYSRTQQVLPFSGGLELLGLKWLPCMSATQAKEVTPCEAGDRLWKESVHTLMTEPCMALAVRGVNAFAKLTSAVPPRQPSGARGIPHHDILHARTAEEAYTFIRLFFTERELFSDPMSRPMLPYIPHHTSKESHAADRHSHQYLKTYPHEESLFDIMQSGPRPFTTFMLIKPRAFQRHLPKIFKKLTQEGFRPVALRLQILTEDQALRFIPEATEAEKRQKHVAYLTSGPCLCMAVQRENAVKKLLDLLGPDDSMSARRQSQFYWRGVFGVDDINNAIYGSLTYKNALEDLKLFFPDGQCCKVTDVTAQEQISCPAVDQRMDIKYASHREVVDQAGPADLPADSLHSMLQQTTCIVLTPLLMRKLGSHYGYVDVIEGLVNQGFEFAGARMVWFTQDQAQHFLCLIEAGNFQQVPMLQSGASIVLALQRDNAVLAFDTLLRETFSTERSQGRTVTDSLFHKYGQLILRPGDLKQARNLLGFFFDELLPSSRVQVLPKLE